MRVHIFKLSISHIFWLAESVDLANLVIVIVVRQCPLGPFRSRLAPRHDQWSSICRRHLPVSPLAVLQWCFLLLAGLTHPTTLSSSKSPKQGSCWRVDVLVCEDSGYSLKYWFVKAIPSCGGAHLHDMFKSCTLRRYQDFRLGCIFFLFLLSLVLGVNSPNATTLHSRCIWEGVLRI